LASLLFSWNFLGSKRGNFTSRGNSWLFQNSEKRQLNSKREVYINVHKIDPLSLSWLQSQQLRENWMRQMKTHGCWDSFSDLSFSCYVSFVLSSVYHWGKGEAQDMKGRIVFVARMRGLYSNERESETTQGERMCLVLIMRTRIMRWWSHDLSLSLFFVSDDDEWAK
jgi:hypothetical protein